MLKRPVTLICGLAFGIMSASTISASVAPPPPSFIDDIAKQIVPTPTASSFDHYVAVFADDLTVTMDGKQIAPNKVAWVATERHRLGSGLIGHSQKMTVAASATAEKKTVGQRS